MLTISQEHFVFSSAILKRKNYNIQNYNFHVFLYGDETLSLTVREENLLRVFEKKLLRRIFSPRRDEAT